MVDKVFSFSELGFQEFETSNYLTSILESNDFIIEIVEEYKKRVKRRAVIIAIGCSFINSGRSIKIAFKAAIAAPKIIPAFNALGMELIILGPNPLMPKKKEIKAKSKDKAIIIARLSPVEPNPIGVKNAMTKGKTGVMSPTIRFSPKIRGEEAVRKVLKKRKAKASSSVRPNQFTSIGKNSNAAADPAVTP